MRTQIVKLFFPLIFLIFLTSGNYSYALMLDKPGDQRDQRREGKTIPIKQAVQKVQVEGGGYYFNINADALKEMLKQKDFLFINVHIPYEGEIEHTDLFIPYNEIQQNLENLPKDKSAKIVLYCRTNTMSDISARTLVKSGYTNIWNLQGGMVAWKQAGYKLINRKDKHK